MYTIPHTASLKGPLSKHRVAMNPRKGDCKKNGNGIQMNSVRDTLAAVKVNWKLTRMFAHMNSAVHTFIFLKYLYAAWYFHTIINNNK